MISIMGLEELVSKINPLKIYNQKLYKKTSCMEYKRFFLNILNSLTQKQRILTKLQLRY